MPQARRDLYLFRGPLARQAFGAPATVLVAHGGGGEYTFTESKPEVSMKAKSLSKTVKAALVGAVIEREVIAVGEQPVFDLRGERVPGNATGAAEATIVRQFATSAVKM